MMLYALYLWFSFLRFAGLCSDLIGSPPTIFVERNWVVDSTAPVGTVVARVRVSDVNNETPLQYGLEHSTGFNIVQDNEEPLPFDIDENGKVTTNTTLTNKVVHRIAVIKFISNYMSILRNTTRWTCTVRKCDLIFPLITWFLVSSSKDYSPIITLK